MNNKLKKSQILMLSLLASLLILTPLLSSSLRPTYLYLVINILIIGLGAEAGLLSAFSKPPEDKNAEDASTEARVNFSSYSVGVSPPNSELKKVKAVEKSASEKISGAIKVRKVKKCPSTPSLFFIGSGETEAEVEAFGEKLYEEKEEEGEVAGGISGQELFTKAEIFIGNFYKQLKMQREESWNRIHGFYHKAF